MGPLPLVLLIVLVLLAIWFFRRQSRSPGQPPDQPAGQPPDQPIDRPGDGLSRAAPPARAIPPAQAQAGALRGFEQYGLVRRADWRPLLTSPARPLDPVLVERLDATVAADVYYYIVPVGVDDGSVGAAAVVDGVSGEYLEANAFVPVGTSRSWGSMIADWRTGEASEQRILANKYRRKEGGTIDPAPQRVQVYPNFVWKPCYESRSPFYPFRRVTLDGYDRYVRIDDVMFDELTDLGLRRPRWLENEPHP